MVSLLLGGAGTLYGQDAAGADVSVAGEAFLVRGPSRGTSVPMLPANTLSYVTARYELDGRSIDVYLVAADAAAPSDIEWIQEPCTRVPLFRLSVNRGARPVFRSDRPSYTVYLLGDLDVGIGCAMCAAFVDRFEFFREALGGSLVDGPPPEFPAVLELGP